MGAAILYLCNFKENDISILNSKYTINFEVYPLYGRKMYPPIDRIFPLMDNAW